MAEEPFDLEELKVTARRDPLLYFLSQDFLKSSFFQMEFAQSQLTLPFVKNNADLDGINFENLSYLCESVEFPGKTINALDYKIPGYNRRRIAYSKDYNEITTTFIHNIKLPIYTFFNDWVDYIAGENTTTDNKYWNEYARDFKLIQYTDVLNNRNNAFGGFTSLLNSVDRLNSLSFESSKAFKVTDLAQTFVNVANAVNYRPPDKTKVYQVDIIGAYPTTVNSMTSNWADDNFHRLSVTWSYERFEINAASRRAHPAKTNENPRATGQLVNGLQIPPTVETKDILSDYTPELLNLKIGD